ncbi:hypothetical protein HCN44_005068 [Aphidius gifuensis]|uniref:Pre-rRNA-processing protein RIX1 N-terminal domain-containing protein n=1 Tax=Aphidius gifuensis TaxID=684658 RepID=A0A834XX04_APHGI|nr:hypothetical protein HCN44_005068 [Aphidius gifuensis]
MAKVINLLNSLDQNNQQCDIFIKNILTVNSDLPIKKQEIDSILNSIISLINTRLNQSVTRSQGFTLLINIIPKCSKDILIKYASLWITKVIQVLENSQSTVKDITLACQTLSLLIIPCKEIQEIQKQISMQTVKQVILLISNLEKKNECGAKPTEKLQSTIKKIILPLIDSDKKNLVNAGAKCYALLARATDKSFKPVSNKIKYNCWVYNQALIINSIHLIMDELFSGILQLDSVDIWAHLELSDISNDNVIDHYNELEKRFENLCIYLVTMLRGCAGKNSVSPNDVLKLLCRGLAISPENLQNDSSFKNQLLLLSLPKIHIVPYGVKILKLYRQTLKWTDKFDSTQETISGSKPFKNVRIAVYKSLSCWLTNLGTLSGIDIIAEDILHFVFTDLKPEKYEISLVTQKQPNVSKRVARQLRNSEYENSAATGKAPTDKDILANAELSQAALITLQNIFNNSGCLLKPIIYKATQQLICPILDDVYTGVDKHSCYVKNETCRLNLLKLLQVILLNSHPLSSPPTQYAVKIFNKALNDNSSIIVEAAKSGLVAFEKIIHPSAPTLSLPSADTDDDNGEKNLTNKRPQRETLDRVRDILKGVEELEAQNKMIVNDEETTITEKQQIDIDNNDNSDGPTPCKQQKLKIVETITISTPADESIVETSFESIETEKNVSKNAVEETVNDQLTESLTEDESMHSCKSINENPEIDEAEPEESSNDVVHSNEDEEMEMMLKSFVDEVKSD